MGEIIGIENEFELFQQRELGHFWHLKEYEVVRSSEFLPTLVGYSKKPNFHRAYTCWRMWTGGSLYADGYEPEVTTPPIEVKKGCVRQAVGSLIQNRDNLVELVEEYNLKHDRGLMLQGYSAHYNFSTLKIGHRQLDQMHYYILTSLAPAFFPLIVNHKSSGMMVRQKIGRIEVCGEYIVSQDQMRAAVAFMLGTINGAKRIGFNASDLHVTDYGLFYNNISFGRGKAHKARRYKVTTADSRNKELKTGKLKCQDYLEFYLKKFRKDIEDIAEDEVELIEECISRRRKLEADMWFRPAGYFGVQKSGNEEFELPELAAAFARAAKGKETCGRIVIETLFMEWDNVDFIIGNASGRKDYIRVPRDGLVEFYNDIGKSSTWHHNRASYPRGIEELIASDSRNHQRGSIWHI